MKRLFAKFYLQLSAGVIVLGILAVSAHTLWSDRLDTWRQAEQSSQNLLTALARDLAGNMGLLDLTLRGVMQDLNDGRLHDLPPELRHHMLFDRASTVGYLGSLLILDEAGDVVADAGAIVSRSANFSDRDYFLVHRQRPDVGLYVSHPFRSRLRHGDLSIAISRRLSHPDGRFAGVVMGAVSLSKIHQLFQDLRLGWDGTINLFRDDGILLMRKPFDEGQIGQDFGGSPYVQELLQGQSATFESVSPIDGIRRVISFGQLGGLPLVLTVALSVDEVFAAWTRKALIMSLMTGLLCLAVVGLTALFRSELNRRKTAETKLRRLARTDDLTGLPNRRAFREAFEREWRHAVRTKSSLALLYVDADFFKDFNDRYGHNQGDEVLRAIACTVDANIRRPRDMAARHGGEEFAVILPETDLAGARGIGENIRQAVETLGLVHANSPYRLVTVSIGVAAVRPLRGSTREALLEAADQALYGAKAAGRNCVRETHAGTAESEDIAFPYADAR
ncbi:diguanylate cyclase [Microvirga sp. TS319]|uniref:sensor domain-containing diguanylate cyclase n=1 Tax=Microvirga sp. TS319 TaxID=3241165 RepID=UPI00351AA94E